MPRKKRGSVDADITLPEYECLECGYHSDLPFANRPKPAPIDTKAKKGLPDTASTDVRKPAGGSYFLQEAEGFRQVAIGQDSAPAPAEAAPRKPPGGVYYEQRGKGFVKMRVGGEEMEARKKEHLARVRTQTRTRAQSVAKEEPPVRKWKPEQTSVHILLGARSLRDVRCDLTRLGISPRFATATEVLVEGWSSQDEDEHVVDAVLGPRHVALRTSSGVPADPCACSLVLRCISAIHYIV